MCSKAAYARGWCKPGKRSSALTAPVLECTTAGYPCDIEGNGEGFETDFASADGSGTVMVLSKQERSSPLVRCLERASQHYERSHWLDSFTVRGVTG